VGEEFAVNITIHSVGNIRSFPVFNWCIKTNMLYGIREVFQDFPDLGGEGGQKKILIITAVDV
jgi:hypothetical protein